MPAKRKRKATAKTAGRKQAGAEDSDSDEDAENDENDPGAGNRQTRAQRAAHRAQGEPPSLTACTKLRQMLSHRRLWTCLGAEAANGAFVQLLVQDGARLDKYRR